MGTMIPKNKIMLYLFIISTLFLVIINFYDKVPKVLKYIYYSLYIVGVLVFLVNELYRAIKR